MYILCTYIGTYIHRHTYVCSYNTYITMYPFNCRYENFPKKSLIEKLVDTERDLKKCQERLNHSVMVIVYICVCVCVCVCLCVCTYICTYM